MILWLFYRNREVRKRISFSRTKSGRYLNRKTGFLSLQLIFHHFMYGMHIIIVINSAWLGLFLLDAIISFCAGTWVECCCCGRRRRRIANRTQRSNATFKWKQVFFFSSIELVWIVRHQSIISKSMDPINLYIYCLLVMWTLIWTYRTFSFIFISNAAVVWAKNDLFGGWSSPSQVFRWQQWKVITRS